MTTIATLFQHTAMQKRLSESRAGIAQLAGELATGRHADFHTGLGAEAGRDMALRNSVGRLETHRELAKRAKLWLNVQQQGVSAVASAAGDLQDTLLRLRGGLDRAGGATLTETASGALAQVRQALNTSVAGSFVFSGTATFTPPLRDMAAADAALAEIRARHDLRSAEGMTAFLDELDASYPALFAEHVYAGSTTGRMSMAIDTGSEVELDVKATEPSFERMFGAMHALASIPPGETSKESLAMLVERLSDRLGEGIGQTVALEARIGSRQRMVEQTLERHAQGAVLLNNAIAGLESVDEEALASRLLLLQAQLEAGYVLTSRLQRLSLVNYL